MENKILAPVLCALILAGCAANVTRHHHALIERLNKRGPIALSSENPFIAANLLLAKEMENSADLKGFIEHRGSPGAIEVSKEFFGPLFLTFYYPQDRQYYSLEDIGESSWLIKGPFGVGGDRLQSVNELTKGQGAAASLVQPSATVSSTEALEKPIATNQAPTPSGFQSPAPVAQTEEQLIRGLATKPGTALAELSPRGDLVHYVTYAGEDLNILARWYTLDATNEDRLRRMNNITPGKQPSQGDSIVVPSYLVKNKTRLTEKAIAALAASRQ